MRIALIGDVHANLPALEAVLQHAHRHHVDEVWGVGDWVGNGAFPDEVVQSLQQHGVKAVIGNYDLSVLKVEAKRAKWGQDGPPENWQPAAWAYDRLSEESREYVRSLPPEMRLEVQGRHILLTHASPASQDESLTDHTPVTRLHELAQVAAADVVVVGHTHVPMARKVGRVWFINTGSVGQPPPTLPTLPRTQGGVPGTQGGVPGTQGGVTETRAAVRPRVAPFPPSARDGVPTSLATNGGGQRPNGGVPVGELGIVLGGD